MAKFTNPEAFQFEAAAILAAGYEWFPMHFDWPLDADNENYPTENGQSRADVQRETVSWLTEHGYLTTFGLTGTTEGQLIGARWSYVQLTERALVALNAVPDVLQGKEPLGKRLISAVKANSFEAIRALVPIAIRYAFGGDSTPG